MRTGKSPQKTCLASWPATNTEQCSKKNRSCVQVDRSAELRVKNYRPRQTRRQNSTNIPDTGERGANTYDWQPDHHSSIRVPSALPEPVECLPSFGPPSTNEVIVSRLPSIAVAPPSNVDSTVFEHAASSSSSHSSALLMAKSPDPPAVDASPQSVQCSVTGDVVLTRREAFLLNHFAEHLARWLDCTDASRLFSTSVTSLAKSSPILLHSVLSFAARHVGDSHAADQAQEKCIQLLIPLLSSETVGDDEAILCATVILRVCEQLTGAYSRNPPEYHVP